MKILYSALSESFWMHITEVVNCMAEMGHEVHLAGFLRSRPESLHPSVIFYNITLRNRYWRDFGNLVFLKILLRWVQNGLSSGPVRPFSECWLKDIMDTHLFDLVYERNCFSNPAIALARRRNIPSILEFNGIWPLEAGRKGYSPDQIWHDKEQEVFAARLATRVVCVSQGARDYYKSEGVDSRKFHVIPNGANIKFFRPIDNRQCRKRLGLPFDDKIIGFSGSLQEFYEVDCVIRALPLILNRVPDACLVVVGREYPPPFGPGRSKLRSLANQLGVEPRVKFIDTVPYEEVPYYINSFDVCLLPLVKRDNWQAALSPLKLREYMACERPVVASDVAGDLQILKELEAGLLYKPGVPKDLAEKVCAILENPASAQQMAGNGHHYVAEHGTWRHVTERILAIANEIVASPATQYSIDVR